VLQTDKHTVKSQQLHSKTSVVGLDAMRTMVRIILLLVACLCVPLHSSAQSQQQSGYSVSIRELRIPPKALQAFEQGMDCLAKKDAAGSLPHFQKAILEFADYYEAYDRIGAAYLKLWRIPEAEQAFRKSIALSAGQYAHPLLALGAILSDQEKFAEAESVSRRGLDLDPDSWRGHYYLGLALYGLNRLEEAEKSIHEALHWKPDFPEAYLLLADIHGREEDYRALVTDLNEYLQLVPDGLASGRAKALRESVQRITAEFPSDVAVSQTQP
jgi:tetratricopeptide (TPR) repeat protein